MANQIHVKDPGRGQSVVLVPIEHDAFSGKFGLLQLRNDLGTN